MLFTSPSQVIYLPIIYYCVNVCVFPGEPFFTLHVNCWGAGILIRGQDTEENVYFQVTQQMRGADER